MTAVKVGDGRASAGGLIDLARNRAIRHDGNLELMASAAGARTRTVGESIWWDRRNSEADPTLVIAAGLAASVAQRPARPAAIV